MPASPLLAHEREEIRAGIEHAEPTNGIALKLGRCPSTISREIARNGGRDHYRAVEAQQRADAQRSRPKASVFENTKTLADHVMTRLRAKDSPMTIAKELEFGLFPEITVTVSHETIYTAIHAQGKRGLAKGLHTGLQRRRRCRKHRRPAGEPDKTGPLAPFRKLTERPSQAEDRQEVGHFEGDLIVGAYNRSAIVTLVCRASRLLLLAGLPFAHGSEATLAALVELMDRIPEELRRSLTWDQGREMATHRGLLVISKMPVFFAEPHSPWQRGSNENMNGIIRRYVGKGTDLARFGPEDLIVIENRINTMPRRIHQWKSAEQVYTEKTR